MKIEQKIGVVGNGFVGGAVKFGFSPQVGCDAEVRVYDKNPAKSTHTLEETINESDFIFVSVPTPANEDGSINIDVLDKALSDINDVSNRDNCILIRSTIVPGTTRKLQQKYSQLNLLFNPEFLTERSAIFDFINHHRFIIGSGVSMSSATPWSCLGLFERRWTFFRSQNIGLMVLFLYRRTICNILKFS